MMKINYRLEVEYQIFEKKGRTYFETDNYVFNTQNSQQNRVAVINKYESFNHVFELASKTTNDIVLSVTEVINKNISGFKIPFLNIYYSTEEFTTNNPGTVLFGGYLGGFKERIDGLVSERDAYKEKKIKGFKTAKIKDRSGATYKIITGSPFVDEDHKNLKVLAN